MGGWVCGNRCEYSYLDVMVRVVGCVSMSVCGCVSACECVSACGCVCDCDGEGLLRGLAVSGGSDISEILDGQKLTRSISELNSNLISFFLSLTYLAQAKKCCC